VSFTVRSERVEDAAGIAAVHRAAFEQNGESALVDELRRAGLHLASFVSTEEGRIVAHALFSRVHVEAAEGLEPAVALGPTAVLPEYQRMGHGGAVIGAGLESVRAGAERLVLVLGDPAYYGRFGFDSAVAASITAPWSGRSWMGMVLHGDSIEGRACYPEPWSLV